MTRYKPAWYPDPQSPPGSGVLRWYDGTQWTSNVHRPSSAATSTVATGQRGPGGRGGPRHANRGAVHAPMPTSGVSGASWDSIPQPGTTFRPDTPSQPPNRRARWLVATLVLVVVVGLVLYTTGG